MEQAPENNQTSLSDFSKGRCDQKFGLKSLNSDEKTLLINGIMMYDDPETKKKIEKITNKWKKLWKKKSSTIQIFESVFMPIPLKPNWAKKIKTNRVYFLDFKNRILVNETFDKLHREKKMRWSKNLTSFEYSVFVIWKTIIKNEISIRKNRAVVDIRELNEIIQIDAYPMSTQTEIIVAMTECSHISIMNAQGYFYQWTVKEEDRYKQTIIIHRGQEEFSVTIMKFKNSSTYVQKQTDLMLKDFRGFIRIYIDDIVIFFTSFEDHVKHLNMTFQRLAKYNVILSSKKSFLSYSSIILLSQVVNAFEMITAEKKLTAISKLAFFKIFKKLKTYLELTEWLRMYIFYYAQVAEPLQFRKTLFLKKNPVKKNQKRFFSRETFLINAIDEEYESYQHLQKTFNKSNFLIHFNPDRFFFIDVNASKQRGFGDMTFHVLFDSNSGRDMKIKRIEIQPIMFLNKQFSEAKKKYWSTKLKITGVVWMIKKIRHLIESCKKSSMMIFTDHSAIVELINQTFLIIFNTDKLNLRLIRVFQYLFMLFIRIKVKFERFHVIPNAFSRLESTVFNDNSSVLENLNDLKFMFAKTVFTRKVSFWNVKSRSINEILKAHFEKGIFLIKMDENFSNALKEVYETENQWRKIRIKLKTRVNRLDTSDGIEFILKSRRIYYVSRGVTLRLCIPWSLEKKIYIMIHDDHHHCGFHRAYAKVSGSLYIKHLSKKLRRYIKHCKTCLENQTTKHAPYGEFNFIKIFALPFHIIIIDFVVSLFKIPSEMNAIFFTTNKFSKRVSLISGMTIWSVSEWASPWLTMLQKKSWRLSKTIIFDRDLKFVAAFWKVTFNHLKIALLFSTAYHSQTDGQSERINQTVKIALKYALMKEEITDFARLLSSIQSTLNNSVNASTGVFSNEILYGFKVLETTDFFDNDMAKVKAADGNSATTIEQKKSILKKKTEEAIAHAQTMTKIRYDPRHKLLNLEPGQKVFIKLHKEYKQPNLFNRKFSKQKIESATIVKKIEKLIYRLNIFQTWKIHSVIFVTQLEPASPENDPYEKKNVEPEPIEIEGGNDANVYEVEKIIAKRMVYIGRNRRRRAHSKFRIKWSSWRNQHNRWMKKKDLDNCKKLLQKFENKIQEKDDTHNQENDQETHSSQNNSNNDENDHEIYSSQNFTNS